MFFIVQLFSSQVSPLSAALPWRKRFSSHISPLVAAPAEEKEVHFKHRMQSPSRLSKQILNSWFRKIKLMWPQCTGRTEILTFSSISVSFPRFSYFNLFLESWVSAIIQLSTNLRSMDLTTPPGTMENVSVTPYIKNLLGKHDLNFNTLWGPRTVTFHLPITFYPGSW